MKAFVYAALFINCALLVSCDFSAPKWIALRAKCIELTGMDESHVHNAKQGEFSLDDSFKMYLKCLMDEENLWTHDGKADPQAFFSAIPDKLKPVFEVPIKECVDEVEHDPEQHELAFKLAKCLHSKTLDNVTLFDQICYPTHDKNVVIAMKLCVKKIKSPNAISLKVQAGF